MTVRRRSLSAASVTIIGLLLSACGAQLPDARPSFGYSGLQENDGGLSSYAQGKVDFAAGRYGLAIKRFRMAMAERPDSVEAVNALAASYDQIKRFDLAERYYRRALAMDPNSAQTLNNLGYSMLLQGKADLAQALLDDAGLRAPDNVVIAANAQIAAAKVVAGDSGPSAEPQADVRPEAAGQRQPPPRRPAIVRINAGEQSLRLRQAPRPQPVPPQAMAVPLPVVETRPLPVPGQPAEDQPATMMPAREPVVRVSLNPGEGELLLAAGPAEQPAGGEARDHYALDVEGSVEVANGAGRRHMAARMKAYLVGKGLQVVHLSNADHFAHVTTTVTYLPGYRELAEFLSTSLPIAPRLQEVSGQIAGVRIQLGGDLLEFDNDLLEAERNVSHADPV